ncbi:MAG TPA: hypothetical protein VGY31_05230 [Terriglobia bacterium]|nr:hypothetical protein [Terriglobia bacterium]
MKRKLSRIEHALNGNVVCFVSLEGRFTYDQLRWALACVQRKHPALRAVICTEADGLYYEDDPSAEIPLRLAEGDYWPECETELTTDFDYDKPQLRVVWLQRAGGGDLVFATSHRICDGMSILIVVKEVLTALHSDEELLPYQAITVSDIIGGYRPANPWKFKLVLSLLNSALAFVPKSGRTPMNPEHFLEWKANRNLSDSIRQRAKAEGVSVHAALLVALNSALWTVFRGGAPKWISSQIDPRRGRFSALKQDMLFFGGGSFKTATAPVRPEEFWVRARTIQEEMPWLIDQELAKIPARFHFFESLRPLSDGQWQWIVRLSEALKGRRRMSTFTLSNLGNVDLLPDMAPLRVNDFRLHVHSFKTKALGLVPYSLNGEMRFYCVSHEDCMTRDEMAALQKEFMTALETQVTQPARAAATTAV